VRIEGFRSCDGTTFSPHRELSVLIGPNGSGKTNILQGIALLAAWLTPTAGSAERAGGRRAGDPQVTAGFRIGDQAVALRATVRTREGDATIQRSRLGLRDEIVQFRHGAAARIAGSGSTIWSPSSWEFNIEYQQWEPHALSETVSCGHSLCCFQREQCRINKSIGYS